MKSKPIPVILFHLSEQIHVSYALRAARLYNTRLILIADAPHAQYIPLAETVLIADYTSNAVETLRKHYRHLSTNPQELELACIERWFILLEYMRRHDLDEIVYLDSDVMSYCNYTGVIRKHYADTDFCACLPVDQDVTHFSWTASGHISYWKRTALQGFCDFILDRYLRNMADLETKWHWHQANNQPGGVCDMTLIYLFWQSSGWRCGNLLTRDDDRGCFDVNMNTASNVRDGEFAMRHSLLMGKPVKAIRIRDGQAFGQHPGEAAPVRFYALHFQGSAKKLMPYYLAGRKSLKEWLFLGYWTLQMIYGRFREIVFHEG